MTKDDNLGLLAAADVIDGLASALLAAGNALHECACRLSTETTREREKSEQEPRQARERQAKPTRRTLPGRSGMFDTKRMRLGLTVKFSRRSRPTEFADTKRLGKFLTGMTPAFRLFELPRHIDTAEQYIAEVKRNIAKLVAEHRPELGEVEYVVKTTSAGERLRG